MYICPTLGEDHEKDFLVCGNIDNFKIIAFSNLDEYEKGFEYLKLIGRFSCLKDLLLIIWISPKKPVNLVSNI